MARNNRFRGKSEPSSDRPYKGKKSPGSRPFKSKGFSKRGGEGSGAPENSSRNRGPGGPGKSSSFRGGFSKGRDSSSAGGSGFRKGGGGFKGRPGRPFNSGPNGRREDSSSGERRERPWKKFDDRRDPDSYRDYRDGERKEGGESRPYGKPSSYSKRSGGQAGAGRPFRSGPKRTGDFTGDRREGGGKRPDRRRDDDRRDPDSYRDGERKEGGSRPWEKRSGPGRPFKSGPKRYGDKPGGDRPNNRRDDGPRDSSKRPYRGGDSDKPRERGEYARKSFVQSKVHQQREERPRRGETLAGDGKIRLNRYISNSGVCSRREADELIAMGLVTVNGKAITEMGYKVSATDDVRYEGRRLKAEKPVYILLNKPKGYITTTDDPQERNTVMNLIAGACKERVYPVGRLDRNTSGLLLLTNDGDLTDKLTHPSYEVKKIYKAELDKPLTKADFQKILDGVQLEEGKALVDDLAVVSEDGKTIGLEIHIGWNRVIRRIFETLGYDVIKLDRSVYAGLDKKELSRGHWRFLRDEEVIRLKHFQ
jgi:23S rRNA pseudouridine2605 synthase